MYTTCISEECYEKYCFTQTYAVFAARGTSLNEHSITGGTEIQFKNNDLHCSGTAEFWQR